MEIAKIIENRRSIRKYKPGFKLPMDDIKLLLHAGMLAPSEMNCRAYDFVVVQKDEILSEIVKCHPYAKFVLDAGTAIIVVARPDLEECKCSSFYQQDCSAVTQNILLQAVEMGYGTCWCGLYPSSPRYEEVRDLLKIEKGIPFSLIAIGIPDINPPKRGKYEEEKVTFIL